jgi:glycosyl transferase family 7 (putative galactosyltransferase)
LLPDIPHLDWSADQYPLVRDVYEGAPGGGIVVIKRVNYEAIGGIPHAFCGWGSEDRALALLCETLLGPCVRDTAELLHLFHQPQPKTGMTTSNLQILRRLGNAALHGKDALVAAVKTLPRAGGTMHAPRPHVIKAVDHAALAERQSVLSRKRRRIP